MLYDKFVNKYVIKGRLIVTDPVHIGSAAKESLDPGSVDNSVLKDARGIPVIPGSSVKGVVRSYFESVLRGTGAECCDVLDNRECCTEKKYKPEEKSIKGLKEKAEFAYECSCDACRLFGGREFAGKIHIKDAYLIGTPSFEYRDGVGIDRETGAAKRGAKYDYEVVSKDSEFDFMMTAENLDEKQKKYFDFIIHILESGELSVGGKTSRGLGGFRVEIDEKKVTTAEDMKKLLEL